MQREVLQDGSGVINGITSKVCDNPQTLVAAGNILVVISMTNYMVLADKGDEELLAQELDGWTPVIKVIEFLWARGSESICRNGPISKWQLQSMY